MLSLIGFREAVLISQEERADKREKFKQFKETFINVLKQEDVEFSLNGLLLDSLPQVLNLSFPGTNVETMLVNLDMARIAVSGGSACTAGSVEPSHVLVAMFGKNSERLINSIRFSFGFNTTDEQIVEAAHETASIVRRLRK